MSLYAVKWCGLSRAVVKWCGLSGAVVKWCGLSGAVVKWCGLSGAVVKWCDLYVESVIVLFKIVHSLCEHIPKDMERERECCVEGSFTETAEFNET